MRTQHSAFPPARLKCPAALARRPGRRFWIIMHAAAIRRSPVTFRTSAVCTINNGQGTTLKGGRSASRFARNIRKSPERWEERSVGKEGVSTCKSGESQKNEKNK